VRLREDVVTQPGERALTEERIRQLDTQQAAPLSPLRFSIEDTGSGVRVTIVNDGPLGPRLNGAVRYDVYWAETVDTTTAAGKLAGFTRATCLSPSIPATNVDRTESTGMFNDPKFAAGWFYLCGVDAAGNRSDPTEPARVVTGAVDNTIPGDVRHFRVSESGVVTDPSTGTVFSELSCICEPPTENIANFGGVQLFLKDYLAIGDTQEGFFQHWDGAGGISFAPLYPIPRRHSTVSVTATNGSANVTAASGLMAVALPGEQFELLGQKIIINAVTDTQITLASNWPRPTITTADYVIVGKPTIYAVSVSKTGTHRGDIENAPSVSVLMDGDLSAPNFPPSMTITAAAVGVRISWTQVESRVVAGYSLYRSSTFDNGMNEVPPQPASTTILINKQPHNPNLAAGGELQFDDTNFTPYELETNAEFYWYVTTTNIRGDESDANYLNDNCRTAGGYEIDPTVPGSSYGKNLLYNGGFSGTAGNQVLASDTTQDAFIATDASNLPGVAYGMATAQANGTGRFQGYTRWEAVDGGTGASGTVRFQNGDEIHIPAPGVGNVWYIVEEIGAWDHATQQHRKIEKGGVYTMSVHVNHNGSAVDGAIFVDLEQYDNNTFRGKALRRFRDTNSDIVTDSSGLEIDSAGVTATLARYQASFQMDASLGTTRQLRVSIAWSEGTTGTLVVRRVMLNQGEKAAAWSNDMGDTTISIPAPTNPVPPVGDGLTRRDGDARVYGYQ